MLFCSIHNSTKIQLHRSPGAQHFYCPHRQLSCSQHCHLGESGGVPRAAWNISSQAAAFPESIAKLLLLLKF